jgi:carbonic anhydrase/acetyltransferase-like protein (isoleucine patch superfamily)
MIAARDFFQLEGFRYRDVFGDHEPVWGALDRLNAYLMGFFQARWPLAGVSGQVRKTLVIYQGSVRDDLVVTAGGEEGTCRALLEGVPVKEASVIMEGAFLFDDRVILGPGTVVEPGALIKGPAVIGAETEVRQGAYIRGNCLVGDGCIVGHTTEIKNSIMLDGAKAGHFAYIGDSILGKNVNLGAGTKLANLKIIPGTILVNDGTRHHDTGRRKLGAILGDATETGCNSVTSPGTLLGPRCLVYPCVCVPAGCYPARTVFMPSKDALKILGANQK